MENFTCYKMIFLVFLAFSVILAVNATSSEGTEVDYVGAKLDMLIANIMELQARVAAVEEKNHHLEMKNTELEKKVSESDFTTEIFDCYRTEDWSTEGVITFNGCSVDTTTGDPWTGSFTIVEPGLYRFTFTGRGVHPFSTDLLATYGYVYIKVDGEVVATATAENYYSWPLPDRFNSVFTLSLNTIQELGVGQLLTVEWEGANGAYLSEGSKLYSTNRAKKYTHFTGQLLGSAALSPPQCEFTGQTFEYPGSCRKYYICLADGTVELADCCPDVYNPIEKSCVSEADGSWYLCNDEDNC